MIKTTILSLAFGLFTSLVPAVAQTKFVFVSEEGFDQATTLASMTLSNVRRANEKSITELAFTSHGESLFGFGPIYEGSFDDMSPDDSAHFFLGEGNGGLLEASSDGGTDLLATAVDLDPPRTTLEGVSEELSFSVGSGIVGGTIWLDYIDAEGQQRLVRNGTWLLPEPTLPISLTGVVCGLVLARIRKSRRTI